MSYFCMSGTTEQSLICLEPFAFGGVWPNWNQFGNGWLTLGPVLFTYWSGVCRCCVYFGVSFRGTYLETDQTCYFIGGGRHRGLWLSDAIATQCVCERVCVFPKGLNQVKSGVWTVVSVTHIEFGVTRCCVWSSTAVDWKCNHCHTL